MRLCWFVLILFVVTACGPKQSATTNGSASGGQTSTLVAIQYVGLATFSSPITVTTAPSFNIYDGRVFWVSNCTTNIVLMSVAAEIQRPSGWELVTKKNNPHGKSSLLIQKPSSGFDFFLKPGQAAYGVPQGKDPWGFAPGDVWRVKAFITEQAHGVDAAAAAAINYPDYFRSVKELAKSGKTNISLNPTKVKWFGAPIEITGPAIVEQKSISFDGASQSTEQPTNIFNFFQ